MASAEAEVALDRLASLQHRIADSSQTLTGTETLLNDVDSLHRHLLNTAALHNEAHLVAEDLIDLSETLVSQSDETEAAHVALGGLLDMRDQLVADSTDIAQSRSTLTELVRLKDDVLAQTNSISDAIVTLERTVDLTEQFQEASRSFDNVRRWLTDVILMEPTVHRAMEALEPLTALGDLRRVSPAELRQAAQVVREIRQTELAKQSVTGDVAAEVASSAEMDTNR
jgi:hypothetical protein